MNDKGNSSTPPIYDHQPHVTHTRSHTQTHICGWGSCKQKIITLYYMEKGKDATSLMNAAKTAIWLKVTHNQTGRRICTGERGEGGGWLVMT